VVVDGTAPAHRGRGQRGSALLLIPAGFLALLVLAALAIDQARIFGVRRELLDLSASIAADAVAASLDADAYHADGDLVATEARGRELLEEQLAARGLSDRVGGDVVIRGGAGGPIVEVSLWTSTTSLFARFAPGGWARTEVRAVSSAELDTF
jgi:hypothetical protein